jgi:hypothetical protein
MTAMTATITAELLTAADTVAQSNVLVRRTIRALSVEAYDLASRASEDLHGVGMTGLVEDYLAAEDNDRTALRMDIWQALRAAANRSTTNTEGR